MVGMDTFCVGIHTLLYNQDDFVSKQGFSFVEEIQGNYTS